MKRSIFLDIYINVFSLNSDVTFKCGSIQLVVLVQAKSRKALNVVCENFAICL